MEADDHGRPFGNSAGRVSSGTDVQPLLRRDPHDAAGQRDVLRPVALELAVAVTERAGVVVPLRGVERTPVELVGPASGSSPMPSIARLRRRCRRRGRRLGRGRSSSSAPPSWAGVVGAAVVGAGAAGAAVVGAVGLATSGIVTSSCGRFSARLLSAVAMLMYDCCPSTAAGLSSENRNVTIGLATLRRRLVTSTSAAVPPSDAIGVRLAAAIPVRV